MRPLTAATFFLLTIVVQAQAGPIYWTDFSGPSGSDTILRANADGSGIETLVTGLQHPSGITLDLQNNKMYWGEIGGSLPRIGRANLDGTGVETVTTGIGNIGGTGLAVDPSGGKIYYTAAEVLSGGIVSGGQIWRANLDGSSVQMLAEGLHPAAIALDLQNGKVYWSDLERRLDGIGTIQRSNLDGSNIETILTGIDEPYGLALDPTEGKLYWIDQALGKIQRSNLDGSGIEDLLVGLDNLIGIGLDLFERRMYWTNSGGSLTNRIQRANLDGSGVEVIVSGVGFPGYIAVVPEPSTALLLLSAKYFYPASSAS